MATRYEKLAATYAAMVNIAIIRERLVYSRQVIWAPVSKAPILVIISRDPEGKEADDFFFSTAATDSPALSVSDFSDRWSVEDTFRNVKQYLGAEQQQSWKDIVPERAGTFSYLVYGLVWLARINREGEKTASIQREWYCEKDCVSFLDALADLRLRLWRERIIAMSSANSDHTIIQGKRSGVKTAVLQGFLSISAGKKAPFDKKQPKIAKSTGKNPCKTAVLTPERLQFRNYL